MGTSVLKIVAVMICVLLQTTPSVAESTGLDELVGSEKITPSNTLAEFIMGSWYVVLQKNPMDDSTVIVAGVPDQIRISGQGEGYALMLKCVSGERSAQIDWNEFLGKSPTSLKVRFGDKAAETQSWPLSADRLTSLAPRPGDFFDELADSAAFAAQVQAYNGKTLTAVFSLEETARLMAFFEGRC